MCGRGVDPVSSPAADHCILTHVCRHVLLTTCGSWSTILWSWCQCRSHLLPTVTQCGTWLLDRHVWWLCHCWSAPAVVFVCNTQNIKLLPGQSFKNLQVKYLLRIMQCKSARTGVRQRIRAIWIPKLFHTRWVCTRTEISQSVLLLLLLEES